MSTNSVINATKSRRSVQAKKTKSSFCEHLDKVAIVTGASSGIGLATAKLLSKQGAKLALVSRSKEKLEQLARAFQFVTLDGSFNILHNCSISQFITVRSSKEFRRVSIANSARYPLLRPLFSLTRFGLLQVSASCLDRSRDP